MSSNLHLLSPSAPLCAPPRNSAFLSASHRIARSRSCADTPPKSRDSTHRHGITLLPQPFLIGTFGRSHGRGLQHCGRLACHTLRVRATYTGCSLIGDAAATRFRAYTTASP